MADLDPPFRVLTDVGSTDMNPSDRPKTVSVLTKLTYASAPFLSTFLLIHLSAPVLANVGGSHLSTSVMLFGREYYQTSIGERYLLLTPFILHVTSGLARRFLASVSSQPQPVPRKITSTLSLAAYASLVFLPIHVITHRLAPTELASPIFAVGPAELDYEFVKTALSRFPWRSWMLYAGLVVSVLVHATEGANVLRVTWFGARRLSSRARKVVAGVAALPVLLGLWTLSMEPLMALSSTIERYSACLMGSWAYRI